MQLERAPLFLKTLAVHSVAFFMGVKDFCTTYQCLTTHTTPKLRTAYGQQRERVVTTSSRTSQN
jgi:hypothetical protein